MSPRLQRFFLSVFWLIAVGILAYVIPHAALAEGIATALLGATPTTPRFVGYVLANLTAVAILWIFGWKLFSGLREKQDDFVQSSVASGVVLSIPTVLTITLLFGLGAKANDGSLAAFFFSLLKGKFEPRILFVFFGIAALFIAALLGNRNISAIFRKEFRIYFTTPIAYAVMMLFTLIAGFFFYGWFATFDQYAMMPYQWRARMGGSFNLNDFVLARTFNVFGVILLFLVPILTMRLIAEERKNRTFEFLMTAPISTAEIVIGKYISVLGVLSVMLALTFVYPLLLGLISPGSLEWAPVFTSYLGLFFLVASFAAIGLFCSTLTENQVIAAVVSFGILLLLWVIEWAAAGLSDGWLRESIAYLSILNHLKSFTKGVVELKDVTYYLSVIVFSAMLSHRVVESQRWR